MQKNIQTTYLLKFVSLLFILFIFYSHFLSAEPVNQKYLHLNGKTFIYPRICNNIGYTCSLKLNGPMYFWCYTTIRERAYAKRNSATGRQTRCIRKIIAEQIYSE